MERGYIVADIQQANAGVVLYQYTLCHGNRRIFQAKIREQGDTCHSLIVKILKRVWNPACGCQTFTSG